MTDLEERLRDDADLWEAGMADDDGLGDRIRQAADTLKRYREALEAIANEAERENGRWQHLKRCIAVQSRQALEESSNDPTG